MWSFLLRVKASIYITQHDGMEPNLLDPLGHGALRSFPCKNCGSIRLTWIPLPFSSFRAHHISSWGERVPNCHIDKARNLTRNSSKWSPRVKTLLTASQRKNWPRLIAEYKSEAQALLGIRQNRLHIWRRVLCRAPDCCGTNNGHQEYSTWQLRPIDSFSPLKSLKSVLAFRSIYCQQLAPNKHLPEALFIMLRRRYCEFRDRNHNGYKNVCKSWLGIAWCHTLRLRRQCGSRIGRPSSPDHEAQTSSSRKHFRHYCEPEAGHEATRSCCGSEQIGYAGQEISSIPLTSMKLNTTASQRKYWPRLIAEHRSEAQALLGIQQNRLHIRRRVLCRAPDCCGTDTEHQE